MKRRDYIATFIGAGSTLSLSGCTGQLENINDSTTEKPPTHEEAEDPWINIERETDKKLPSKSLNISGEATLETGEYTALKVKGVDMDIATSFLSIEVAVTDGYLLDVYTLFGDSYSAYQDRKLPEQGLYDKLSQEGVEKERLEDGTSAGPIWVVFDNTKLFGTMAEGSIDFNCEISALE